jgi:hypothetical protein
LSHALVTIIAAVPSKDIASLRTSIAALGNPAIARLAAALGGLNVIHFASLNVFEASAGGRGHLVLEFSGDGSAGELLRLLDQQLGADLGPVFAHAEDRGAAPLLDFWRSHIVETGQTLLANPGLGFAGTPGLSVERIRRERGLALHLADLLHRLALRGPALERVASSFAPTRNGAGRSLPNRWRKAERWKSFRRPWRHRCPSLPGSQVRLSGTSYGRSRFRPGSRLRFLGGCRASPAKASCRRLHVQA